MAEENRSPERFLPDGFDTLFDTQVQERRRAVIPNLEDILNGDRIDRMTAVIREEREKLFNPPKSILIEKNLSLIKYNKAKKDSRLKMMQKLIQSGIDVKSNLDDVTADITSFENIDFNRPCSKEEIQELKKELDYFVYRDCADEINCEINSLEENLPDLNRLNYCNQDPISEEISEHFKPTDYRRIPEDYEFQVQAKVDACIPIHFLKRRVLVEKIDYPTHTKMARYDAFIKSAREMGRSANYHDEEVQNYRNAPDFLMERLEVVGDLRRLFLGEILGNNGR